MVGIATNNPRQVPHKPPPTVNLIQATMPADATLKSPNVCANCKARKKRCDKSLPRCRYCAEYHAASTPTEDWNTR
ncbi:hypothetical protein N7495_003494 [Penicillium taxi]|uniref:uncharacterized protein n=1 Tax=Penicillium taxi TaxID=168475 RepID=UPI0025459CB7|nr:uncharacterized protein N7495_003494 [Penicillium taxi]KAJ5898750.1 hypothetical protein N7495_003494 [Penicillium taxi]